MPTPTHANGGQEKRRLAASSFAFAMESTSGGPTGRVVPAEEAQVKLALRPVQ